MVVHTRVSEWITCKTSGAKNSPPPRSGFRVRFLVFRISSSVFSFKDCMGGGADTTSPITIAPCAEGYVTWFRFSGVITCKTSGAKSPPRVYDRPRQTRPRL